MIRDLRPRMESLEGRWLLSTAVVKPATVVPALESIKLQAPPLVSQQSSTVTLTISRSALVASGLTNTVTEQVTTGPAQPSTLANGKTAPPAYPSATAGVQYQPINQTVTFAPGVTTQTITIPVVAGASNPGRLTFGVTATPITSAGAETAMAVNTTVTLANNVAAVPPAIVGAHLVKQGKKVLGIAIRFNEPMNPASVDNINAYAVSDLTNHNIQLSGLLGLLVPLPNTSTGSSVPLKSVSYNPATNQVTLYAKKGFAAGDNFQVQNGNALLNPIRNNSGIILNDTGTTNNPGTFLFKVNGSGWSF